MIDAINHSSNRKKACQYNYSQTVNGQFIQKCTFLHLLILMFPSVMQALLINITINLFGQRTLSIDHLSALQEGYFQWPQENNAFLRSRDRNRYH